MIFLYQIRKVLIAIGLVVMLSAVATLGFAPGESWANPVFMPGIDPSHRLVATMSQAKITAKQIEGKAQEGIGKMTGDLKTQATGKAKQFEANTQEAILESIDNPSYQPNGKSLRKRNQEAVECLENDVSDCFNQTQGPD